MNNRCSMCNKFCETRPFRGGYICEDCLDIFKSPNARFWNIDT
ncbi:MAG: hypothetical protein PHV38_00430 [Eubacteriales bacterium]|nr:hypothetical protein [Eubacteriales bacterium]